MKRFALSILVIFTLALCGCAPSKSSVRDSVAKAFGQPEFVLAEIPSHGLIADGIAIAAGGGANTTSLRRALEALAAEDGQQYLAVTGDNQTLTRIVLTNAVKDLPKNSLQNLHIAFVSNSKDMPELEKAVKNTGAELVLLNL